MIQASGDLHGTLSLEFETKENTGGNTETGDTDSNFSPYLSYWNRQGESIVKTVKDIILMSINTEIKMTHFGFGEFGLLAYAQS